MTLVVLGRGQDNYLMAAIGTDLGFSKSRRHPGHELFSGTGPGLVSPLPEPVGQLLDVPVGQETAEIVKALQAERERGERLTTNRVTKIIAAIGEKAGIVVHVEARSGKKKYASAHDFRRAFGDRWDLRVMPPVLTQLMRHESIDTTMRFYVGRSAQATADVVWEPYKKAVGTAEAGKTAGM